MMTRASLKHAGSKRVTFPQYTNDNCHYRANEASVKRGHFNSGRWDNGGQGATVLSDYGPGLCRISCKPLCVVRTNFTSAFAHDSDGTYRETSAHGKVVANAVASQTTTTRAATCLTVRLIVANRTYIAVHGNGVYVRDKNR